MMNEQTDTENNNDGIVDAVAAVVLITVFVAACVFWVSTQ